MKNYVFTIVALLALCEGCNLVFGEEYPRYQPSQELRQTVWENSRETSTGQVRDPGTGKFMSRNEPWDMGHKPGYEFSKHKDSAIDRALTPEQFRAEGNNPNIYRPESPSTNRSHKLEAPKNVTNYPKATYWQTFKRYAKPVVKTMSRIL